MTITAQQKKIASGLLVGAGVSAASAVLGEIVHALPSLVATLPVYLQIAAASLATGAIGGVAHIIDAWGHTERVEQAVAKAKSDDVA